MKTPPRVLALASLLLTAPPLTAETFTNISGNVVDFPAGAVSFADELVEFTPGRVFDPDRDAFTPLPSTSMAKTRWGSRT